MTTGSSDTKIALYSRTYWDVEVAVPLTSLSEGKGKVDADVQVAMGGFACNAACAIAARFGPRAVRVVTVTSWMDWPRLRASLPEAVVLDAISTGDVRHGFPPITVVVNPADECRILRDRLEDTDELWRLDEVSVGALDARLHVLGRLPAGFVTALLARARSTGARVAWCGGDTLPREVERQLDLVCVNRREANRLLGGAERSPRECADGLARRAEVAGAVRIVTGGGGAPTVAAWIDGDALRFDEVPPGDVEPARITRLLGVGDAFAATLLATACFDDAGHERPQLALADALAAAQAAAADFLTTAGIARSDR